MPKLPRISGFDAIRILEKLGFIRVRQKGSHVVMKKTTPSGAVGCSVPLHSDLAVGTLAGILKLAKVTNDEFIDAMK
jgi:predicted RNA binding protein YcfA (HicA-like mRNA interferase family)